jgi:hypothetical protein
MTTRDFAFWLQGFFEITGADKSAPLTGHQTDMIRAHLDTVFEHEAALRDPELTRRLNEKHNPPGLRDLDADWPIGGHVAPPWVSTVPIC